MILNNGYGYRFRSTTGYWVRYSIDQTLSVKMGIGFKNELLLLAYLTQVYLGK